MTKAKPTTIEQYLGGLADDRRELVETLLDTMRAHLDAAFEEGIQYGMPAFFLPHSVYPDGYHCDPKQPLPFASVAATKGGASVYLFCVYLDEQEKQRFADAWKATGNRLDMGKSCVRVKRLDQVPLDVLGKTVERMTAKKFVRQYEKSIPPSAKKR